MDFGNALLLVVGTLGLIQLLKTLVEGPNSSRIKALEALVAAYAIVFLVGSSFWAKSQVIGNVALDKMSGWDKVTVALFLAGAAAGLFTGLKALGNIGSTTNDL